MFHELLFEELFLPFLARHMCRHMYKGRGMYMCGMILAAIWVLVVSTLLSLVLFTLGSSVHIRSGGGGLLPLAAG